MDTASQQDKNDSVNCSNSEGLSWKDFFGKTAMIMLFN